MGWFTAGARAAASGGKAGSALGRALGVAGATHRGGRSTGLSYLAPGAPPPPPTASADFLDYRGAATWEEASALVDGAFPVGSFADLKRGKLRGPVGLPAQLLNRHAVIVGPSGSGKTHSLIIPWIYAALVAEWSVVAVDVTGDLRSKLESHHRKLGGTGDVPMAVWDFLDPGSSHAWEWLTELDDDARVDAAATAILGRRDEGNRSDPFFYQRDYQTLRGLLRFTPAVRPAARTVAHLINTLQADAKLVDAIKRHPAAPGARDLVPVLNLPPEEYSRAIAGVLSALAAFDLPGANHIMKASQRPQLRLEEALDANQLLVVGARVRGGQASETLASLMLNQLVQRFYERFGQQRRPVLLVVDEAPRVAGRVDLAQTMEVARGAGVGVVLAMQDIAQFSDPKTRSSIQSNAASMFVLPGASPQTVEEFGKRLGTRRERKMGMSFNNQSSGWGPASNPSFDHESLPVLGDREIMAPPVPGRGAVLHVKAPELAMTGKPMILDLSR